MNVTGGCNISRSPANDRLVVSCPDTAFVDDTFVATVTVSRTGGSMCSQWRLDVYAGSTCGG